MFSFKDILQQT